MSQWCCNISNWYQSYFQTGVTPHTSLTIWLIYVRYLLKSCAHRVKSICKCLFDSFNSETVRCKMFSAIWHACNYKECLKFNNGFIGCANKMQILDHIHALMCSAVKLLYQLHNVPTTFVGYYCVYNMFNERYFYKCVLYNNECICIGNIK